MAADWPEWTGVEVVSTGLPAVPGPAIPPFNEAPVATWRAGNAAAVLFIYFDPDDDAEPYSQDIETLVLRDGKWTMDGRGGADWPVTFGERPRTRRPILTGFSLTLPAVDGQRSWISSGIAPRGIQYVASVAADGREEVVPVEPTTGAFLVYTAHCPGEAKLAAAHRP